MKLCRILLLVLMILAGLLALTLGNVLALPAAALGILATSAVARRRPKWLTPVAVLFAIGLFLTGSPLNGGPPDGLLLTAVMAGFLWAWAHTLPTMQSGATAATARAHDHAFSVAFYLSLAAAYLLLRQRLFELPPLASVFAAVVMILLGLAVWEISRRSRHGRAQQLETATAPDHFARVLSLLAILLATFFLFRLPLPWIARHALGMAENFNATYPPKPSKSQEARTPKRPPRPSDAQSTSDSPANSSALNSKEAPAYTAKAGEFPYRADLRFDAIPQFCLRIHDPDLARQYLEKPLYVRTKALSVFQGEQWKVVDYEGEWIGDVDDGQEDGRVELARNPAPSIRHTVYHLDYLGDGVPLIQNPTQIESARARRAQSEAFELDVSGYTEYAASSVPLAYDSLQGLAWKPTTGELHLLAVDDEALAKMLDQEVIAPAVAGKKTLPEKLAALRQRFHEHYRYSTKIENPQLLPPLRNFLAEERQGYCDFFATAGALAARRLGVPARVAFGYAGGSYDAAKNLFVFEARDAHAWTEIEIEGHGWTIFDVTPPAQGAARGARAINDAPNNPADLLEKAEPAPANVADAPAPSATVAMRKWDWNRVLELALRYLDWLLAALALILGLAYLIRRARQRKKEDAAKTAGPQAATLPEYFAEFCALFAKLGFPRDTGETLREYCRALQSERLISGEFDLMLAYHYAVRYEDQPRKKPEERGFRQLIREREQALSKRSPRDGLAHGTEP